MIMPGLLLGIALVSPLQESGVRPKGLDGHVLNLDFEAGDLRDWTATGKAFAGQPIEGDLVAKRRADMRSRHQGKFWIGGFERFQDPPTGTLTSAPFVVTHPWGSFLLGGGPNPETRVEIIRQDSGAVVYRASGVEDETMARVVVDLKEQVGKVIRVRIVDEHKGHWGHINFDDFMLHATRPAGETRKAASPALAADVLTHAGLKPLDAARAMTVPEEFTVSLFAGEPDVHQPVALSLDDRGRVWIAEAFCYPRKRPDAEANDRIVIFEDTDGDGKHDKRTVFMDKLNLVSGFEVGHGGVWIGAAPHLMYVPIDASGDKPAGPPQILLDGWGMQDTHETLNTFSWGPDGWLWGCHGVFTHSRVGKPGTPDNQRTAINAGIWRYHPTRHVFDVVAHGTSNPWGLDFNSRGEAFIEACVIPHAFHIVPGARYQRQAGSHFNPHTYSDIPTIADHRHYLGANPHSGNNKSDSAGGGHAHCGAMIYLGGTWPQRYHDGFFMGNIHGRRLNMDILKPAGSGYVASHGPDFLMANDAWARFINFRYGPDGNVYIIDWYDKQACHTGAVDAFDRTNGRIYKVSHRSAPFVAANLATASTTELIKHQEHANDWFVRHARRLLAERGVDAAGRTQLQSLALKHADPLKRLRGVWALHVSGGIDSTLLDELLKDSDAHVRGWSLRLAAERGMDAFMPAKLERLAKSDPSPVVRREIAALVTRVKDPESRGILAGLLSHHEDAGDPNLPFLCWYALEPLVAIDPSAFMALGQQGYGFIPSFTARRLAALGSPEALAASISAIPGAKGALRKDLLIGLEEGLRGRRGIKPPEAWNQAFDASMTDPDPETRERALSLATQFGDARALVKLRARLSDAKEPSPARLRALEAIVAARDTASLPNVIALAGAETTDINLRAAGVRALAAYDANEVPDILVKAWKTMPASLRRDAVATLASRSAWGLKLMDAVAAGTVATADIPAETVRQLGDLRDPKLLEAIAKSWGQIRATPADRKARIAKTKALVSKAGAFDLAQGRAIYQKVCAQCHTMYGTGGKVGPELTGSNRANLDYLLENIHAPSAVITKEYTVSVIEMKNGRVVSGIVKAETPQTLSVVTANEVLTVPVQDIETRKASDQSMMPDNLLDSLKTAEIRDLVAYLRHPSQTPIAATPQTLTLFFNGKDLSGWTGEAGMWRVENGELVGISKGLKRNSFLASDLRMDDFRLEFEVKLSPDSENSGVQIRSALLPDGEMAGPQADIGKGWWGKLYEEHGRGLLWSKSGEAHVKPGAWNRYVIEAKGARIRTWINDQPCVDLTDGKISRSGQIGLQLHSGGPLEVRYRGFKLELLTP